LQINEVAGTYQTCYQYNNGELDAPKTMVKNDDGDSIGYKNGEADQAD